MSRSFCMSIVTTDRELVFDKSPQSEIQESMGAPKESINFRREIAQGILHVEELTAVEALCELADGESKKTAKNMGKRKVVQDGYSNSLNKKFKHLTAVCDTNNNRAQSLRSKVITRNSGDQNYLHTGKGDLKIGAPSYPESSFSITHLLSAVRLALVTPFPLEYEYSTGSSSQGSNQESFMWCKEFVEQNLPYLSINQIVQRLRFKPGDPRNLECEEPLIELVRGVLETFVSKTTNIYGKPLVMYDRLTRKWRWTGPLPHKLTHQNCIEVDFSPLSWGLPLALLITLIEEFSICLKRVKPRLQLMATLPQPPLRSMQAYNFQKRFGDRKRLNQVTIGQCSDEIRAYFHREEAIRYVFIDRSFKYTALDGAKSSVAPLRKNCEKTLPNSRVHHTFKDNIPPKFTLLSLVRDASARLPGGVGTKADICVLVRGSQYVVDDIQEKTLKQIVTGALDRLHSEVDPCVKFNREWGLWVYLHGDREEEDFREDGTSSLKK